MTNVLPAPIRRADEHYWRLVYADGSLFDESEGGRSVKDSPPDAIELHVMKIDGQALWRVKIPKEAKPVWYRIRSIDVRTEDSLTASPTRLDATVFGHVSEGDVDFNGKLWMLQGDKAVDVPAQYLDRGAIENCWSR